MEMEMEMVTVTETAVVMVLGMSMEMALELAMVMEMVIELAPVMEMEIEMVMEMGGGDKVIPGVRLGMVMVMGFTITTSGLVLMTQSNRSEHCFSYSRIRCTES